MALTAKDVMETSKIIPVVILHQAEHAVPLAQALLEGGIRIIEVTLRTQYALGAIEAIRSQVPDIMVGAGTITSPEDLAAATDSGAQFLISPGMSPKVLAAAKQYEQPFIPGVATPSDIMLGLDHGLRYFKFFPAIINGGLHAIEAFKGPFPDIYFCPTGGINETNYLDYLDLPNVPCVGGSWVCKQKDMQGERWVWISDVIKRNLKMVAKTT